MSNPANLRIRLTGHLDVIYVQHSEAVKILVDGYEVLTCVFLAANIAPIEADTKDSSELTVPGAIPQDIVNEINSIDDLAEHPATHVLENVHYDDDSISITPEEELMAHASNIQAWVEHDYDTHLLHSSVAFPLLDELARAGDEKARRVLEGSIDERIRDGNSTTRLAIIEYASDKLTPEQVARLLADPDEKVRDLMVSHLFQSEPLMKRIISDRTSLSSRYILDFLIKKDKRRFYLDIYLVLHDSNKIFINKDLPPHVFTDKLMNRILSTPTNNLSRYWSKETVDLILDNWHEIADDYHKSIPLFLEEYVSSRISDDNPLEICLQTVKNPIFPIITLKSLTRSSEWRLRAMIALREDVTNDIIDMLTQDDDEDVLMAIYSNPAVPKVIKTDIITRANPSFRARVAKMEEDRGAVKVNSNPLSSKEPLPIETLEALARSEKFDTRYQVIRRPETPLKIINEILRDPNLDPKYLEEHLKDERVKSDASLVSYIVQTIMKQPLDRSRSYRLNSPFFPSEYRIQVKYGPFNEIHVDSQRQVSVVQLHSNMLR